VSQASTRRDRSFAVAPAQGMQSLLQHIVRAAVPVDEPSTVEKPADLSADSRHNLSQTKSFLAHKNGDSLSDQSEDGPNSSTHGVSQDMQSLVQHNHIAHDLAGIAPCAR
jgi:hypothetical protein